LINIGGTGKFLPHILEIFALFMFTGILSTLLLPETKGISLEDLSQEDQSKFDTAPSALPGQSHLGRNEYAKGSGSDNDHVV
jgi:PHS family inorganic phosphate transporter-like MFS transporter